MKNIGTIEFVAKFEAKHLKKKGCMTTSERSSDKQQEKKKKKNSWRINPTVEHLYFYRNAI